MPLKLLNVTIITDFYSVEKSEVTSSPIGAIGGGVGGTAVVLIIAISVVFFMRYVEKVHILGT